MTLTRKAIDFVDKKILIIGDLMLDRYWHGGTSRISPEAPVPIVHVKQTEDRPGGAGNVALNIKAMGADVTLISAIGDDANGKSLTQRLEAAGIQCKLQTNANNATTTKLRVISRHQQLIRLDFEENKMNVNHDAIINDFEAALSGCDAIVLSDYGKGTLQNPAELIALAKVHNKPIFVDPKSSDFSCYQGATCITPNMSEFEAVVGPCPDEETIAAKAQALLQEHHIHSLLITRSEHGMTLIERDQTELHIPTQARDVFDVTGAGDTVIAALATCVAAGFTLRNAMQVANTAAGIVVAKLGAATASAPEIRSALNKKQLNASGVLNQSQLLLAVAAAKEAGEKIVMTNGCFDILHAGHIQYLQEAKALGQRLIVAVNSDASVKRLKGEARPINTLEQRMAVLAALGAVDWVVDFDDDTPQALIAAVLPNVLVKGGDYEVSEIAGHREVIDNGGDVKILEFVKGLSTSNVVDKIKA
jgi:D-beta-D-heptose 7-phosphate kinase / D-beta-D-heptose 1-phosphate adenosyltransferase